MIYFDNVKLLLHILVLLMLVASGGKPKNNLADGTMSWKNGKYDVSVFSSSITDLHSDIANT